MRIKSIVSIILVGTLMFACKKQQLAVVDNIEVERAKITLDSIYTHYSINKANLLRETYPFDDKYSATYLASEASEDVPKPYAYLWPYSGTFSAVNALYNATKDTAYLSLLENKVLAGLESYFDTERLPAAYSSYINTTSQSDRFYDDNIWIGIDFTDLYMMTKEQKYLDKATLIWKFIQSGTDNELGGGIYWCEQSKKGKNTCSSAPGAVYALKLFEATSDSTYFQEGKDLYAWTYRTLRDPGDNLYYDNIKMNGDVDKNKYAYNSGQMMQAAAILYRLTGDKSYLLQSQEIAKSCYDKFFIYFVSSEGEQFRLLKKRDIWFTAVMLRGFSELYKIDKNKTYIDAFKQSLDYAWAHSRSVEGLFEDDWSGLEKKDVKLLLPQAAMVEIYAHIGSLQ